MPDRKDTACENGLHVITRLRDDAVLHYAPPPKKEGQKGRPNKYGDRFSAKNPDTGQLPCITQTEGQRIYGGVVYVKSLKRMVKIALVHELKEDGTVKSVKIFICKGLEFPAIDKSLRGPFSMADIKTQYFNELVVDRVFDVFANIPNITKNHPALQNLYNLGKIAA